MGPALGRRRPRESDVKADVAGCGESCIPTIQEGRDEVLLCSTRRTGNDDRKRYH